jgi:hypothetical protein
VTGHSGERMSPMWTGVGTVTVQVASTDFFVDFPVLSAAHSPQGDFFFFQYWGLNSGPYAL